MDSVGHLVDVVEEFAAGAAVTVVPVVPERGYGPEVSITPDVLGLPEFLDLAGKLGGGVLYLETERLDPGADVAVDQVPSHLMARRGQVGRVSVAFAVNGVVHFWEVTATWFEDWLTLEEQASTRVSLPREDEDGHGDERLSEEERDRLADELAQKLVAMPEFRAAKSTGGARQRLASQLMPADTHRWVRWDAVREAVRQADELAAAAYEPVTQRLGELAAELTTVAEYQQARTSGARKQVAEHFLLGKADGFSPPAMVRDELVARAQEAVKAAKSSRALF
ncbi:hypothetical protein [Micromonospora nigra]|uniref:hypothetical protein n=1 Tax=Micromonospora nigra TaxID=145857 RepID=UPI000B824B6C|nr:hypothetical protein [Micromonospora nigra]